MAKRSKTQVCPDKILRTLAFMVALIEKATSTLGTLNFIWATIVLLGGFSQSLKSIDFWFVGIILVVEGLRISCRSGELAIQAATWRSPSSDLIYLIFLYSLAIQEFSALACIVLSSLRIHKQQYGSDDNQNRNRSLNLFYWLSVVESSLTLLGFSVRMLFSIRPIPLASEEKSSWTDAFVREISKRSIINNMAKISLRDLRQHGLHFVSEEEYVDMFRRFFYETYSRCMNGSVFDSLKMDFLTYSLELLPSIDDHEQLTGALLLSAIVKSDWFPSEKLRVIGTTPGVLERLIEMLNWEMQRIRRAAAEIISKLVEIPRNRIRVMAIPKSRESITSLVRSGFGDLVGQGILDDDHDNRAKMGTNRIVLRKIIKFTKSNPEASESEILRQFEITQMETLASPARKEVRDNTHEISGIEADHSDYPNLQSVSIQV